MPQSRSLSLPCAWFAIIHLTLCNLGVKVQLHVSALVNGHLQVVHEILIKQLYKTVISLDIAW